jgi:hypothetical protein
MFVSYLKDMMITVVMATLAMPLLKVLNVEQSYLWLKFGDIKGETESTTMVAQDQEISTNYFNRKILKQEIESKCSWCNEYEETIDHLT